MQGLYCSILEEQILAAIEQALFCKEQQHKSLIHLQYTTLLCHNFRSNVWQTGIKIQRTADLLSFVFRAWDSTMWNKPDICSANLQVEMCWLLDPLRICGPVKQHNLWLQSNTLWSHASSYGYKKKLQYCRSMGVWLCWIRTINVPIAVGKLKAGNHCVH